MTHPPPLPSPAAAGWWGRHWRWAMPLLVIGSLAAIVGCCAWSLWRWSQAAHASAPLREAMRRATCSVEVVAALGEPLQAGRLPYGNMHTGLDGRREVGLFVGLEGPRGDGTLIVQGTREDDRWDYPVMYVLGADEVTIDLSALDDAEAALECELATCRAEGRCPAIPRTR
mgnify:FL=1